MGCDRTQRLCPQKPCLCSLVSEKSVFTGQAQCSVLGSLSFLLRASSCLYLHALKSFLWLAQVQPKPPPNSCSSLPQLSLLPYLLMSTTFGNKRRSTCIIGVYLPPIHSFSSPSAVWPLPDLPGDHDPLNSSHWILSIWSQQQAHCWPCLLPEMFSPLWLSLSGFIPISSSITPISTKNPFSPTHILHVSIAQNCGLEFWSSYFVCSALLRTGFSQSSCRMYRVTY